MSCLIACEVDTPDSAKPVTWRLLTNREVPTLAAAVELVDGYRTRWEAELLFLTLKEGCRVEALQLSTVARIERALAVTLPGFHVHPSDVTWDGGGTQWQRASKGWSAGSTPTNSSSRR